MKLEVTMKEMQELMNRKGQLEIMGKSYILNPQDELLIKFMMDFKETHQNNYYDILSNAFNDILMRELMMRNPYYQMVTDPMVNPYQQAPAPQMSYNDMKNMYKNQFAQQLGLDTDGDEKHEDPTYDCCDCHVCDGNCEANLPDENKNGIDKDSFKTIKSFLDKDGNLKEDKWCDDCVAMGIECDDNCDKHHEDFEKIKSMSYNLGYKDGRAIKKVAMENNEKDQVKKEEPKGTPVVTPEIIFKPKKKTDDETQKILSSKVTESNEDK